MSPDATQMGRPRAPELDGRILEACFELLGEVGYDRLHVRDVAKRSGVGTDTIYRRWPNKGALVAAAVTLVGGRRTYGRDTIKSVLNRIAETVRERQEFLPGLISAFRDNPEYAQVLRSNVVEPDLSALRTLIARRRPELNPTDVELLAELGPALLITRALFFNRLPTQTDVSEIAAFISSSHTKTH
jgi:AcrR family transcriptional regulator